MSVTNALTRHALALLVASSAACTPHRSDSDADASSSTAPAESTTTDTGTSTSSTTAAATSSDSTSSDSTSTIDETTRSSSITASASDSSSSTDPADVAPPYGPCGTCNPDEEQIDGGPWCICAPVCETGSDCPDPGTGATPSCSTENDICVLLCTSSDQCPDDSLCPDPAELPKGAQGFCYRPDP
jgi:hypothetical protein